MKKKSLQFTFHVIFTLTLLSGNAFAQAPFDSLGLNTKWCEGRLVLNNSMSKKGLIKYNDKMALIKFKETAEAVEESFAETSILVMEFFDVDQSRWRHFAAFNFKDEARGKEEDFLLEVLMEFKSFALLSRISKVNVAVRQRYDYYGNAHLARVGYEQFEQLCLAGDDGTAQVVLVVNEFEKDKMSMTNPIKPHLNKKALEKYLGEDWSTFQDIVKANKLNLKKREDFIRAFEYYKDASAPAFD
jgi:hypothetical protein